MSRRRDISRLDRMVRAKYNDPNWEMYGKGTMDDAQKAVYADILEGWRNLQEAKEHIEGLPADNVIYTARGDEIRFSLLRIILEHIERNPRYSPWVKESVSIMAQSVPKTAPKDRRTAFYVQFWSPKSEPELAQPYYWDGPEKGGAFKTLGDALRGAGRLEDKRPDAFNIDIYSQEEEWEPYEEYPELGRWQIIEGTMKVYDRRGAIVFDESQGGRAPMVGDKLFGRYHRPLPDEAY